MGTATMGTATILHFPHAGLVRPSQDDRRPRHGTGPRAIAQSRINAAASQGYWWGAQDTAPLIAIAFLAGVCFAFASTITAILSTSPLIQHAGCARDTQHAGSARDTISIAMLLRDQPGDKNAPVTLFRGSFVEISERARWTEVRL